MKRELTITDQQSEKSITVDYNRENCIKYADMGFKGTVNWMNDNLSKANIPTPYSLKIPKIFPSYIKKSISYIKEKAKTDLPKSQFSLEDSFNMDNLEGLIEIGGYLGYDGNKLYELNYKKNSPEKGINVTPINETTSLKGGILEKSERKHINSRLRFVPPDEFYKETKAVAFIGWHTHPGPSPFSENDIISFVQLTNTLYDNHTDKDHYFILYIPSIDKVYNIKTKKKFRPYRYLSNILHQRKILAKLK